MKYKLNLGCGRLNLDGFINMDFLGGEIIADASYLPFNNNTFDYILASHVLEHVRDLNRVMKEAHRVLIPGGLMEIRVPTGLSTLYNPFHLRTFNLHTMNYFCSSPNRFSLETKHSLFECLSSKINAWTMPFRWHIDKYASFLFRIFRFFGLLRLENEKEIWKVPIGKRGEILVMLRKIP